MTCHTELNLSVAGILKIFFRLKLCTRRINLLLRMLYLDVFMVNFNNIITHQTELNLSVAA